MPKESQNTQRLYWDSCVFIAHLQNEPGRIDETMPLMAECEAGRIEIHTSTLSIAEVAYTAKELAAGDLSPAIDSEIARLWAAESKIRLHDVHVLIGEEARALIRESKSKGGGLKPADAIHLATAILSKAAEFHTYDAMLLALGDVHGIPVKEPKPGQLLLIPAARPEEL